VLGHDSDLFCSSLIADDLVWPAGFNPKCAFKAMVKIRLASRPVEALVEPYYSDDESLSGDAVRVTFAEHQRAVAPGQSVVFYRDGVIAGGGIIVRGEK
jgi:tRNA-specific 2-thiouridylase